MLLTWVSTVRSESTSSFAIWWFVSPRANNSATSFTRRESFAVDFVAALDDRLERLGAAPGLVAWEVAYWADMIKKALESENWKTQYLDRFKVVPKYMAGTEFAAEMDKRNAESST